MMRRLLLLAPVCSVLLIGCGDPQPPSPPLPPFRPVADVQQLMISVVDPAADVVWGSVGTIITEQGTEERFPKTDEEWDAVRNGAFVLAESGNLLMMGSRAQDTDEWMRLSQGLIDIGILTVQAAEARDKDAVFSLGGDIYTVCSNCHEKYARALVTVS